MHIRTRNTKYVIAKKYTRGLC